MSTLAGIAPRLARAHAERRAELRADEELQHRLIRRRVELDRLVAHRELQLVRAGHRRSLSYIAERQRKLGRAQAEHAAVVRALDQIAARRAAA